ncbi:MAG: polynucleotide adenylyltransferase PcnB [Pseudomonadota bacterium]
MKSNHRDAEAASPRVIPRSEHPISRKSISKAALRVLYGLKDAGYQAHLVGGGVRDLLLGIAPKDFDVATDAHPEVIKSIFPSCRLIGRRFRLAHVRFGREIIEVATFRASHTEGEDGVTGDDGRIVRDNVFGTIEEDALRRDFTVNALYYNIADYSIIDYAGGVADIEKRVLRVLGDPATRYREDAVRMLRAARFSAKLGFDLDPESAAPIAGLRDSLREIPAARLFEEVLKLLQTGHAQASFAALQKLDLLQYLFPVTDRHLKAGTPYFAELVAEGLANTDRRIAAQKPVTPAYLYAILLWPEVEERTAVWTERGEPPAAAALAAADEVIPFQLQATSLPKRFSIPMREIWSLQSRLLSTSNKRSKRLLGHPRFRAAYDFLCLRAHSSGDPHQRARAQYWTELQEHQPAPENTQEKPHKPQRRRRPRRRKSGSGE